MYVGGVYMGENLFDAVSNLSALMIVILAIIGTVMFIVDSYRLHYRMKEALQNIVDETTTPDNIREQARKGLGEKKSASLERRRYTLSHLKDSEYIPSAVRAVAAQELDAITDED